MGEHKVYRAIGLMSGTSLDGVIDVALIETDGYGYVKPLRYYAHPYDIAVRDKVRACFGKTTRDVQIDDVEKLVTDIHIEAVKSMGEDADIIGFHGQTITHNPDEGFTWQLGNGEALAKATGMDVVCDMRQADIKAGGQGAPLLPLYHQALLFTYEKPVAILNLGGVANITYIGVGGNLIAFDCGPANALMDDFIRARRGLDYDTGGCIASLGSPLDNVVQIFLSDEYFAKKPPKSLDRDHWSTECVRYASTADGMATLLEMSVCGVERAMDYLPQKPARIYVAGGGRHNEFMLAMLAKNLDIPVENIDVLGWDGDAIEAQGFAYLGVRSLLGLPLTLPETTGAPQDMIGGVLCAA
ncbi:MAG: anhydro-N-acetylmuramic acid kinase [Zetaproteobacteria bacterium]|nr:MAG: anhydro-N-acetylmuramic acid kinase [Zetaproteobacteria bacterium]